MYTLRLCSLTRLAFESAFALYTLMPFFKAISRVKISPAVYERVITKHTSVITVGQSEACNDVSNLGMERFHVALQTGIFFESDTVNQRLFLSGTTLSNSYPKTFKYWFFSNMMSFWNSWNFIHSWFIVIRYKVKVENQFYFINIILIKDYINCTYSWEFNFGI